MSRGLLGRLAVFAPGFRNGVQGLHTIWGQAKGWEGPATQPALHWHEEVLFPNFHKGKNTCEILHWSYKLPVLRCGHRWRNIQKQAMFWELLVLRTIISEVLVEKQRAKSWVWPGEWSWVMKSFLQGHEDCKGDVGNGTWQVFSCQTVTLPATPNEPPLIRCWALCWWPARALWAVRARPCPRGLCSGKSRRPVAQQ